MNTGKLIRWLTAMVAVLTLMPRTAQAGQAKILMADDRVVKIDAGVVRGVRVGMLAEIYTQSATLVHPVTGETYGNPKVKIARIEVTKVGAVTAEGKFIEHYAPVQPGDIVESIEVAPTAEDQIRASVAQTRAEMKEIARSLAAEIKDHDKSITALRETLRRIGSSERRLQSIANDVRNMRERMVTFESRIVELAADEPRRVRGCQMLCAGSYVSRSCGRGSAITLKAVGAAVGAARQTNLKLRRFGCPATNCGV